MAYRLGIDLGTASIGISVIELNEQGEPTSASAPAVRIFSEPLEAAKTDGVNPTKNKARGMARRTRGLVQRRSQRHRDLVTLAESIGLHRIQHLSKSELRDEGRKGAQVHTLRAKAATERIELDDLLRVLLKMSKRRGYKGRFRSQAAQEAALTPKRKTKDGDESKAPKVGEVEGGINQLTEKMKAIGCDTLGQYLLHRFTHDADGTELDSKLVREGAQKRQTLRLKNDGLYRHRDLLASEFNVIWDEQAKHHDVLKDDTTRKVFFDKLVGQLPLKSPKGMVGNCSLEPNLPRAPRAQPWAQAFRIEKQIADLRWGGGRRAENLTLEQKAVIRQRLGEQETVAFSTLYSAMRDAGCMDAAQRSLNLERSTRDSLSGDKTRAAWRSMKLIEQWDALTELQQIQVINFLADLGSPEELYEDDWPTKFSTAGGKPRQFDDAFLNFINAVRKHKDFGRLSSMGLESGRSAYSIKALKRITEWLRNPPADAPRVDEEAAIRALYDPKPKSTGDEALLTNAPETGNVVVDVALRQLQAQINRIITQRGQPPTQIVVELARQMGLGPTARGDIEKKIGQNQKRRKEAADRIKADTGRIASDREITRYLLWDEQGQHWCPYCNNPISLGMALDGSQTNLEHILPRKLTRVGGKRSQLVLSHASCNHDKNDRTPFQAFGHNPERWKAVELQAERFKAKKLFGKAQLLLLEDWEDEVLDEAAIKDFSDRQFHETSWISKLAALWLKNICPPENVWVSRGEMTAYLRRVWGLDTVIAQVRYEEGLPVLDTDGEPISREDFDEYRDYWEGHENRYREKPTERRLDKRIDHRHHFIDALAISMTSRAVFQSLATEYRKLSERRKAGERVRLARYVAPPLPDLRDKALELVRGLRTAGLTHKPDRHAEGLLFQGTAYNRISAEDAKLRELRQQLAAQLSPDADEKALKKVLKQVEDEATLKYLKASIKAALEEGLTPVQALAQPAEQLVVRDNLKSWAEDKKLTAEKARKNIEGIASEATRKIVSDAFEARMAAGKTVQEAFAEDIVFGLYRTPIKRVLVKARNKGVPVRWRSRSGEHIKYLVPDEYAYMEVCMTDAGKPPRLVTRAEATRNKGKTPESFVRFWKNDTVRFADDGQLYVVRKFSQRDQLIICIRHSETAPNVDLVKKAEGRHDFTADKQRRLTVV